MLKRYLLFAFLQITYIASAGTNLGTISSIQNGMAQIKECTKPTQANQACSTGPMAGIDDVLNFTTTNQCMASKNQLSRNGSIPKCPRPGDNIQGLDNTYPSAGTFAIYTGDNDSFIHDFAKNYLASGGKGKFNLVLPKDQIFYLRMNKELLSVLNNPRVNVVQVQTTPNVGRWMQDSFQFKSLNGKPAIYQVDHHSEFGSDFKYRLTCQLAKKCGIPYYVPPDLVDPKNKNMNSLNSGGNLEVLPGGTFLTGIIKSKTSNGFNLHGNKIPFRTKFQKMSKASIQKAGNRLLEIDISFLQVGHVDEIFNVKQTHQLLATLQCLRRALRKHSNY